MIDAIAERFAKLRTMVHSDSLPLPFQPGQPLAVYGMGTVGKDVLTLLTNKGFPVEYFLDRKAAPGATWNGRPILHPDDPDISPDERAGLHLVIGIFNPSVNLLMLIADLRRLGYTQITTFVELHRHFSDELGDRFWLTDLRYYLPLEQVVHSCYDLWADDASRALFEAVLAFRFSGDYAVLPAFDPLAQYLPVDVPGWSSPLRFVDCGAYVGDTLERFFSLGVQFEAIAAFEPDQTNFSQLAGFVVANAGHLPEAVCLFPNGVFAHTGQLRFAATAAASSHITTTGETVVQCVALDDAIPLFRPTLIKMDIEGAEYDALWGARRLIERWLPSLAICAYHRPEHLWQIPHLINTLGAERYELYLRSHAYSGFDLVVYAVPFGAAQN